MSVRPGSAEAEALFVLAHAVAVAVQHPPHHVAERPEPEDQHEKRPRVQPAVEEPTEQTEDHRREYEFERSGQGIAEPIVQFAPFLEVQTGSLVVSSAVSPEPPCECFRNLGGGSRRPQVRP